MPEHDNVPESAPISWMCWPLAKPFGAEPLRRVLPDAPGQFGHVRRHDIHTGIDLYCELGSEVRAMVVGRVIAIEDFTGPRAADPSPWWNDTKAVLVRTLDHVTVYGEITPTVEVGQDLLCGDRIGLVDTAVLRKFKRRPMVMLHLECLRYDQLDPENPHTIWWRLGQPKPDILVDPTPLLRRIAPDVPTFNLQTWNEWDYLTPEARAATWPGQKNRPMDGMKPRFPRTR